MADSFQSGTVTTLHNIVNRPLQELEDELLEFSTQRPLGLILPSLYSELERPALKTIVDELVQVPYLSQIVIGLDRASEDEYRKAIQYFDRLPQEHQILWNDGPNLKKIDAMLEKHGLSPTQLGKGRNVWYCMGYMLASDKVESVALHDCDIVTYERSLLARLLYPVANPKFRYQYSKGYYSRVANNSLGGRASRLLVTPLIRALKNNLGQQDSLDYMDSFRYPLAGEFSMRKDVMSEVRIPGDWGLEVGLLMEMARNNSTRRICQVEIADIYDHKHQDVSADNEDTGLSKMSIDISKTFFRKLATTGTVFNKGVFRTLKATYYRIALDLIDSYRCDAVMNGLNIDCHAEEKIVELFAENIMKAGEQFLTKPMEQPFVPHWNRIVSAVPDIYEQLLEAVQKDHDLYN
ncbi:MAG: glycosyl transferase [Gammaproteobacteria bacterium]|jgi:glucosyl-3-phosphoglycerate synthase|nr:glycosyl transferase [Gammaproteobacteria bacterium]MBT3724313.1 glycosyl transferase [Gammaproteobacteria bacterium]MBT4076870.1 glycosyl transferase [Gammaproteobacteria bacterium]MBT4193576.1 glycosyl transferase [Gammaproteobacteria bacterium]MBT4452017.1 glycosyl transferase [Gammaproteobacteria bacterium]